MRLAFIETRTVEREKLPQLLLAVGDIEVQAPVLVVVGKRQSPAKLLDLGCGLVAGHFVAEAERLRDVAERASAWLAMIQPRLVGSGPPT